MAAHCRSLRPVSFGVLTLTPTQDRVPQVLQHARSHAAGDAFLAITGSARIKVYDRDGRERGESLQGDMYIRDLRNTKGHVSPCTNGAWHPLDRLVDPKVFCGAAHLVQADPAWDVTAPAQAGRGGPQKLSA